MNIFLSVSLKELFLHLMNTGCAAPVILQSTEEAGHQPVWSAQADRAQGPPGRGS